MSKSVLLSYIIIADVTRIKREVKIGKKHIKVQFWAELIHRPLKSAAPPEVINRSLLPSHHASKEAGPHSLSINSTTVGTALHETHAVLAETTNSAPSVASWMPSHQGEPGLCHSSGPLERPTVVQAGRDYRHDSQNEGCLDRCIQQRLGSSVCEGRPAFGSWLDAEGRLHINCLEMMALCWAL